MEDNKTVNDMQQTLNEMTPETVEANEVLPQELTSRDLAQILIYLSLRAPISKENRRHLAEAARRLQRERVANISQEGAITVLQSTGWMQEHDREILSPFACVNVLQKCGWMADHDNKLLKEAELEKQRTQEYIDGLREELQKTRDDRAKYYEEAESLREQLEEAEAARERLSDGIKSLNVLADETNRRHREQLEAAAAEKRQLETDSRNLREELDRTRKSCAYEECIALREENEKLKAENASHKRNTDQMNNIIRHLRHEAAESVSAPEALPLYRIHDCRELAGNPANIFVDLLRIAKKLDRRLEVIIP